MKKTYVFPGQGSQVKGMGEHLFNRFPELVEKTDEILGYSITDMCLNNPDQKLNQTQYTQPALYVVNALSYLKKIDDEGKEPDFLAGHSLGEYNALQAAGVISFEVGLEMVKKRGELMSQVKNGKMAAILNAPEEKIQEILQKAKLSAIDIANLNSPNQIVISGLEDDLNKAQPHFEKADAMFIPLNTSGAFHSRYMKPAEDEYKQFLKKIKLSKPSITVIANVNAQPYTLKNIRQNLTNQLSNCVKWTDSIVYLLSQGTMEFEELGVGDVLTKLIGSIKRVHAPQIIEEKSNKRQPIGVVVETSETKKASTAEEETSTVTQKSEVVPSELVEQWNKAYPVGTKVKSAFYETALETRTEAMLLFGHRAAVYVKGYNGYFDLREVEPIKY
jgi:malonyl CoA-acyl carrier protein transacylase